MLRTTRIAVCVSVVSLLSLACAGGAYKQALREDSPAAYYRFLRDHPDSKYTEEAQARLDFHKVKRRPTLEGLEEFAETHPQSELLDELRPLLEEQAYTRARAIGTSDAYRDFAENFPGGSYAARATGNAAYLEAGGFAGRVDQLARFADEHPDSDHAAEARRSAESLSIRDKSSFGRVALFMKISATTPQAERVQKTLEGEAVEYYRAAGVELVPASGPQSDGGQLPVARLVMEHDERQVDMQVSDGQISRPGWEATTVVTLQIGAEGPPIWRREFGVKVEPAQHIEEMSMIFGPAAGRYWAQFFAPVSTWQSNSAIRSLVQLAKPVTAVDSAGERAVVLFRDGDFQVLDLADPAQPVVLAEHRRNRDQGKDFTEWTGVSIAGDRLVLFGPDGMELLRMTASGVQTVATLPRGAIGSLVAVEATDEGLLLAGNRGLILCDADGQNPVRILRRDVRGLARVGEVWILSDDSSVLLSTTQMLSENRVLAQLRLGRGFAPGRIRAFENRAVVVGEGGVLVLDTSVPRKPRVMAQVPRKNVGDVRDATGVGGRIYLLGDRGLQLLDPSGRRVVDSVDLGSRERLTSLGRHVVAIGSDGLQVVDGTPFAAGTAPASAR